MQGIFQSERFLRIVLVICFFFCAGAVPVQASDDSRWAESFDAADLSTSSGWSLNASSKGALKPTDFPVLSGSLDTKGKPASSSGNRLGVGATGSAARKFPLNATPGTPLYFSFLFRLSGEDQGCVLTRYSWMDGEAFLMAVDVTSDGTLVVRLGDPQNKTTLGTVPKDRTVLVVGSLEADGSSPAQMRAALLDGEGPLPTSENDITFQTLQGAIPSDRAVALRITSWPSKDNNTSGSPEDRSIDELRIGESLESVLP